ACPPDRSYEQQLVGSLSHATIDKLRDGLNNGRFSSLDLVEVRRFPSQFSISSRKQTYLARISQIDGALHAVIETNPDAVDIARKSDDERKRGELRGPFHGMPFLVKDMFCTLDKMKTSAGSYVLANTRPSRESTVVTKLRDAGATLLGKTNLSEWANLRAHDTPDGWSPLGGQSYAPYHFQQDPTGSSSGSAIATATGMCAFALGIETSGSIVEPAGRCAVVGLKPTVGLTSRAGLILATNFSWTAGKDPLDQYTEAAPPPSDSSYISSCRSDGLAGVRVGVPRKIIQESVGDVHILGDFENSLLLMKELGAEIVEDAIFRLLSMAGLRKIDFVPTQQSAI
ncbi:MAG: hypothetical protein Q9226_008505, partial [Calogaya cf. arnoldii]